MLKKNKLREWVPWEQRRSNPDIFYFREDRFIPNSPHPLLVYRSFFDKESDACENWLRKKFINHKWFPFSGLQPFDVPCYYVNTHIVLGVCAGEAKWQLGGTLGLTMVIEKGDVLVIPAGVALRNLESSADFKISAASSLDVIPKIRKEATSHLKDPGRIADISIPETDPVLGTGDGLLTIWLQTDTCSR